MNKKLFLLLVVLMSMSLIGIIFVQGYWIKSTVDDKEEQFSYNAKQVLINVSKELQNQELENFWFQFNQGDSADVALNEIALMEYFSSGKANGDNTLSDGIVEEDDKVSSDFLISERDSIEFAYILNESMDNILAGRNGESTLTTEEKIEQLMEMSEVQRNLLRTYISEFTSRMPIHKRVSEEQISALLTRELKNFNLDTEFEFGVYSSSLATKIHSDNFSLDYPATYSVPLYVDAVGNSNYQLLVNFTGKKKVVLSSVTLMAALSIMFTLIIVIAYSSALSQLIKQRQISQIKTDFINNMTHEFKTPIATINLALDAIKNPKIINDTEKVNRYLQMIRDENKRMNAQVENVLQISKLEKNELDLKKERLHLHDIIEEAITHVELIVEDRNGYVKTHFGALKSSVLANEDHLTNVVVNILDNAIKYSNDEPKIDIYTENVRNYIVLKVRDQGTGMSRAVQKKIFQKFYREHTGDIHNVKGHGLGLAYAKRILDDHHGTISVESERGKGSTFIIKLPLIT
ncbi:HAMP domain-containing histidine kinase [Antarcticibacterium sp. 1MA-6-2]|uniref:sensor histidine kinase n=1 Tax=Antarcticibacterium sp. 1MA-6-2 TaxID=2908210 RepID=UPI001F23A31B|nr:HAMP domain-containing sensor histidine kinase [Antarcticibacterium sp. 1MA-6-2]UJH91191.1 HAMP domain-containing histidine kinase [Antarcticibacterium sp. 1MA-6-2]